MAIASAPPLAVIAAMCWAGTYSRYLSDDFWYAGLVRQLGFPGAMEYALTKINGRALFTAVVEGGSMAGPGFVRILPAIVLLGALAAFTAAAAPLLRGFAGASRIEIIAVAAALLAATIECVPTPYQSFLWQCGLVTYAMPLIFLALTLRLAATATEGSVRSKALLAFGLSLVNGGFSEIACAAGFTAAVLFLPLLGGARRKVLAASAAGFAGGLLWLVLAPGTAARRSFFPEPPPLPVVLWNSTAEAAGYIGRSTLDAGGTLTFLLFLGFVFGLRSRGRSARMIAAIAMGGAIVLFVILLAAIAPAFQALSEAPPTRAYVIPALLVSLGAGLIGVCAGLAAAKGVGARIRAYVTAGVLLSAFFGPGLQLLEIASRLGEASRSAQAWDRVDAILRSPEAKGRNIFISGPLVIHDLPQRRTLAGAKFYVRELRTHFANGWVTAYYGLGSIAGEPAVAAPRSAGFTRDGVRIE